MIKVKVEGTVPATQLKHLNDGMPFIHEGSLYFVLGYVNESSVRCLGFNPTAYFKVFSDNVEVHLADVDIVTRYRNRYAREPLEKR